ncbi:hypothetical protein RUE5091_03155 [Ruegeria denitrificans]|uniref:Uncharacterized protein n=1 Tax=Ruegeria denitrificans TaxID=1715692 RepID=A0A0P1IEZ5_9RHOB|nr:RidA family protein [Ruegeria denitrificans]CUK09251.1 hypothetical protein RUE5091_03155 [Ruegeria denitrificans]
MSPKITQPDEWLLAKVYANGVLTKDGPLRNGGRIGWDANRDFLDGGIIGQMKRAMHNLSNIFEAAGGKGCLTLWCH